jgi:hypothetical protein
MADPIDLTDGILRSSHPLVNCTVRNTASNIWPLVVVIARPERTVPFSLSSRSSELRPGVLYLVLFSSSGLLMYCTSTNVYVHYGTRKTLRALCWLLTACYTRDICTHNSAACVSGNIKVEVLNQIKPVVVHIKHALKNLHTSWHQGAHGA